MNGFKVIKIDSDFLEFDNGVVLTSEHESDCCESHFLSFNDLDIKDFDDLEFDLDSDEFFTRIEDYGISLNPIKGFPVRIAGYGNNNGYYSSELTLNIMNEDNKLFKSYDITECQNITDN